MQDFEGTGPNLIQSNDFNNLKNNNNTNINNVGVSNADNTNNLSAASFNPPLSDNVDLNKNESKENRPYKYVRVKKDSSKAVKDVNNPQANAPNNIFEENMNKNMNVSQEENAPEMKPEPQGVSMGGIGISLESSEATQPIQPNPVNESKAKIQKPPTTSVPKTIPQNNNPTGISKGEINPEPVGVSQPVQSKKSPKQPNFPQTSTVTKNVPQNNPLRVNQNVPKAMTFDKPNNSILQKSETQKQSQPQNIHNTQIAPNQITNLDE